MIQNLQSRSRSGSLVQNSPATSDISSASIQGPEPNGSPIGHLSCRDGNTTRYLEPSYWASVSKQVADLDALLADQAQCLLQAADKTAVSSENEGISRTEESGPVAQHWPPPATGSLVAEPDFRPERPVLLRCISSKPEFLEKLPPRQVCDILLHQYLRGYHPIVPLIHVPSFKQKYETFWISINSQDDGHSASLSFVALLIAVCYAGAMASPGQIQTSYGKTLSPAEVSAHLLDVGLESLEHALFPRVPTLETLTAYLLLNTTWQREEEPMVSIQCNNP